ncbi:MAG: hypothetical protein KGH79_01105 [Patescibacteria group bacterium]|nr:hypothetical protein [Patescibacteria group bacterium]
MDFGKKILVTLALAALFAAVMAAITEKTIEARRVQKESPRLELILPSLAGLIRENCGGLLESGKLQRYNDCQGRVIDGYQLAYGSVPDDN